MRNKDLLKLADALMGKDDECAGLYILAYHADLYGEPMDPQLEKKFRRLIAAKLLKRMCEWLANETKPPKPKGY